MFGIVQIRQLPVQVIRPLFQFFLLRNGVQINIAQPFYLTLEFFDLRRDRLPIDLFVFVRGESLHQVQLQFFPGPLHQVLTAEPNLIQLHLNFMQVFL